LFSFPLILELPNLKHIFQAFYQRKKTMKRYFSFLFISLLFSGCSEPSHSNLSQKSKEHLTTTEQQLQSVPTSPPTQNKEAPKEQISCGTDGTKKPVWLPRAKVWEKPTYLTHQEKYDYIQSFRNKIQAEGSSSPTLSQLQQRHQHFTKYKEHLEKTSRDCAAWREQDKQAWDTHCRSFFDPRFDAVLRYPQK
jgi:hypothetical protein